MKSGDVISNIDFRPATGELYGTANRQLYVINSNTGVARAIGNPLDSSITGNIVLMEFDPVFDILRYVTDTYAQASINPETGEIYSPSGLVKTLGQVGSFGYANNLAGSSKSDLYVINATVDALFRIDFSNNGAVTKVGSGLGVNIDDGIGFDISPEGVGVACVKVGSQIVTYEIDLTTGAFGKKLGVINEPMLSSAIPTATVAYAVFTGNNSLGFFNMLSSGLTSFYKPITGLAESETLHSIDMRPSNGQLFGLGSSSRLYTLNMGTATASTIGSGTAFTPALVGTKFSIDFNPQTDQIRVVSNQGQNLVLNPTTGAVQSVDTALNPNSIIITNIAYSNNVANAEKTTLYDISSTLNQLYIQNPPNSGTLTAVGALGVTIEQDQGFDITGSTNTALAVWTVGGKSSIYRINLNSGIATALPYTLPVSTIKSFTVGLVISGKSDIFRK